VRTHRQLITWGGLLIAAHLIDSSRGSPSVLWAGVLVTGSWIAKAKTWLEELDNEDPDVMVQAMLVTTGAGWLPTWFPASAHANPRALQRLLLSGGRVFLQAQTRHFKEFLARWDQVADDPRLAEATKARRAMTLESALEQWVSVILDKGWYLHPLNVFGDLNNWAYLLPLFFRMPKVFLNPFSAGPSAGPDDLPELNARLTIFAATAWLYDYVLHGAIDAVKIDKIYRDILIRSALKAARPNLPSFISPSEEHNAAARRTTFWNRLQAGSTPDDELNTGFQKFSTYTSWSQFEFLGNAARPHWALLKRSVEEAMGLQAELPAGVRLMDPALLQELLARPDGIVELVRRVHPYTLKTLRERDQTTHHFVMHEGMYFVLYAMKLLGRLPPGLTVVNFDPHKETNTEATNSETIDIDGVAIPVGPNDVNWGTDIVGDGLAETVLQVAPNGSGVRISKGPDGVVRVNHYARINLFQRDLNPLWVTIDLDTLSFLQPETKDRPAILHYHIPESEIEAWLTQHIVAPIQESGLEPLGVVTAVSPKYIAKEADAHYIDTFQKSVTRLFKKVPKVPPAHHLHLDPIDTELDSRSQALLTHDQRLIFNENRRYLRDLHATGHITFDEKLLPYAGFIMDRIAFEITFLVPQKVSATFKNHWKVIEERLGVMDYEGPYAYVCGMRSMTIPSASNSWIEFDQTIAAESLHVAQHFWRDVKGKRSELQYLGVFPDHLLSFFEAGEHLMVNLYSKVESEWASEYRKLLLIPAENLTDEHSRGKHLSDQAWENIDTWAAQNSTMRANLVRAYAQLFVLTIPRQQMSPWEIALRKAFNLAFLIHMSIDYFKFDDDDPVVRWTQLLETIREIGRFETIKEFAPIFLENGLDFGPFITSLEKGFSEIQPIGIKEAQRSLDHMSTLVSQIESLRPIREAVERARAVDIEKAIFSIRSAQELLTTAA